MIDDTLGLRMRVNPDLFDTWPVADDNGGELYLMWLMGSDAYI